VVAGGWGGRVGGLAGIDRKLGQINQGIIWPACSIHFLFLKPIENHYF